jgi:hypothetical protein
VNHTESPVRITLGDVWDALEAAGIRPHAAGMGTAFFNLPDGRTLKMPNRSFFDHGIASDELLEVVASWGVRPTAGGGYQPPPEVDQEMVEKPPVTVG